ncbi:hypothetical protein GCM10022236_23800 [Microlunatus ginsengisoli]|uniref:DUF4236 domain-containing protein n=1 Tax=Microlunatus ginsengisoli TaxID=363863 RepID=A0ABP7A0V9_9ACTN
MPGSLRIGRFRLSNRSASLRVGGGPVSYTHRTNFHSRNRSAGGGGSVLGGLLLVVGVIVLLVWIF